MKLNFLHISFVLLCSFHYFTTNGESILQSHNHARVADELLKSYDRRVRPNTKGSPVEIGVTMYVLDISSLCDDTSTLSFQMYFRQFWTDARMTYDSIGTGVGDALYLDSDTAIWRPDTFFPNERQAQLHMTTVQNTFTRVSAQGDVLQSNRLSLTIFCPMQYRHFPMDSQMCTLGLESYGFKASDVRYKWSKGSNSVGIYSESSLSDFKILGHRLRSKDIALSTGNYSRLSCDFFFERNVGYYVLHLYLPATLVVIFAILTLWMNQKTSLARIILGTTCLLLMTTIVVGARLVSPDISYLTSLDIFLGISFLFVVAVLVQHAALVHALAKKDEEGKSLDPPDSKVCSFSASGSEKFIRIILGVLYILFNFLYWIITTQIRKTENADLIPIDN